MIKTLQKHPLPVLLVTIILLLHLPVLFAPDNYLLSSWFITDDAFYYFVTARNVAAGHGFTFDGIAHTNGFHPLWLFLLVPVFALPDTILPLRLLAGVLILLNIGTALLLYRLSRRYFSPGVAFITGLTVSLISILHGETTKGGVEAGLNVFMIALLLNRLADTDIRNLRGVLITSGVASLTFLARLDNVFLAGLSGVWLIVKQWNLPDTENPWRARFRAGMAYYLLLGFVVVGYMGWNLIGFGTPTPVSGQVKRWWGTLPNTVYGFPAKHPIHFIGQFVTNDEAIGPWAILTGPYYHMAERVVFMTGQQLTLETRRVALAGLGILTLVVGGWLVRRNRTWAWESIIGLGLIPLLGGCLFQIVYYKFGGSVSERTWYWVAEMVWGILVRGLVLELVWRTISPFLRFRYLKSAVAFGMVIYLAFNVVRNHVFRIPRIFSQEIMSQEPFYYRRANWLEANTEPGALIGMTGSGSSSYFIEGRTVVNLDGLISSVAYFEAMQNGTADDYLTGIGLDYVFGSEYIVTESNPYGGIFEERLAIAARFADGNRSLILWQFLPP